MDLTNQVAAPRIDAAVLGPILHKPPVTPPNGEAKGNGTTDDAHPGTEAQPAEAPTASASPLPDVNGPYAEATNAAKNGESADDVTLASREELVETASVASESAFDDLRGVVGFDGHEPDAEAFEDSRLPEVLAPRGRSDAESLFSGLTGIVTKTVGSIVQSAAPQVIRNAVDRLPFGLRKTLTRAARIAGPLAGGFAGGPAGAALASALLKSMEAAPEATALSPEEEAQAEQLSGLLESIIGRDDRLRIEATTNAPWRQICALRIRHPDGSSSRGTGFLIGRRAVATAGHCVYMKGRGGFAKSIEVIPGMSGSTQHFGALTSSTFSTTVGWRDQGQREVDIGCIFLPGNGFGKDLGSFELRDLEAATLRARPVVLAGYPGDKSWAEMWGMERQIKQLTAQNVYYDIDTYGGQSGSAVYVKEGGQRIVVGIHNYGDAGSGNSATRVTGPIYELLKKWSERPAHTAA